MSVYGDLLLAFPEQKRSLTVYQMKAKINGGWDIIDGSSKNVSGIYQNTRGKQLKDSNGNLVASAGFEFWTSDQELDGWFTQIKGNVYRLISSNNWTYEGGYERYSLEKVVGNNGTESVDITWNTGENSFY
jgi:hypothetical protein